MKAKKLWLSLLALTLIGALGLFSVTASAADDALCTSTDNCTGTYSNGFC